MREIQINREIRNYRESVMFGLPLRQFVFSALACGSAVFLYFYMKPRTDAEMISWICILGALPFVLLGFVTYNGMTAEQLFVQWIRSEILMPKYLLFRNTNIYYAMYQGKLRELEKERMTVSDDKDFAIYHEKR